MNNRYFEDAEVLETLDKENCLLDTDILKLEIFERDHFPVVCIEFKMRDKSDFKKIRLEFSGISEYGFYSTLLNQKYVDRYKLHRMENGQFYISLDPADEYQSENAEDQDFIYSKSVRLIVLELANE